MIKEITIAGVYVAPFAAYLAVSGLIYLPLRWIFNRIRIERFVWHRTLFDLAVFIILLGVSAALF